MNIETKHSISDYASFMKEGRVFQDQIQGIEIVMAKVFSGITTEIVYCFSDGTRVNQSLILLPHP